ncbi:MAG: T9SS type A sorting domain-containing protein, partial [Bacteroidota bacterium]
NLVELWVTDIYGNQGFCSTWVDVQDPTGICEPPPKYSVEGMILTEAGATIEEAEIYLMGSDTLITLSDGEGSYAFDSLSFFTGYSLKVRRDTGLLDGLTTWDLAKIKQHILGVELLDSPYKIIAADANRSGAVTTVDLLHLQKLILLLTDELPNENTSWRFIPSDYPFTNPALPFLDSFPESLQIDTLQASISNVNWAAIKVGDVNGSAQGSFNAWTNEQRSDQLISLLVPDQEIAAQESVWIPIRFGQEVSFLAMQGSVQLAPPFTVLELRWPALSAISPTDFYIDPKDPQGFRFASYGIKSQPKKFRDVWCEVLVKNTGYKAATPRWTWDHRMPGLGYDENGLSYDLEWETHSENRSTKHRVHPNPVKAGTVIELEGLSLGIIQLEIFDTQGKLIWQTTQQVHSPHCEIPLPPTIWPQTGMYWYQVRGPEMKVSGRILYCPE